MLNGHWFVDAHLHPPHLATLRPAWRDWALRYGREEVLRDCYDAEGAVRPDRFDAHLAAEGVDVAILLCEYSPQATGIQPVEDLLPIVEFNPDRFRILANVNPRVHADPLAELDRQLGYGAVGLKLHPVHGGFPVTDPALSATYAACRERGLPVVVHCGTSVFPGSANEYADPAPVGDVLRAFPGLTLVLAHGGRTRWYTDAARLALDHDTVWIDLAGLPPHRLPRYFAEVDFAALARRFVFGTDWPGVPGTARNARAVAALGLDEQTLGLVFGGNAATAYRLGGPRR